MTILVIGGLGYIGSHCVQQLIKLGYRTVIIDDQSSSILTHIRFDIPIYTINIDDYEHVLTILIQERIELVMHFASKSAVGESVKNPLLYYDRNLKASITLFKAMEAAGLHKIIFSSTCATYGVPSNLPIIEDTPQRPTNPYGQSKLSVENILRDLVSCKQWQVAIFRYFNVIGAEIGLAEIHTNETRLVPLILKVLQGKQMCLSLNGDQYPTPDGTCIRDYIHVLDICSAHIQVISRLAVADPLLEIYNLGLGTPYSVKEIIRAVEQLTQQTIPIQIKTPRGGDVPILYAESLQARTVLGWKPQYTNLKSMLETSILATKHYYEYFNHISE